MFGAGHGQEAGGALARAIELALVADEGAAFARERLLHGWVAAAFDEEAAAAVNVRPDIILCLREFRQCGGAVECCESGGGVRNCFLGCEHRARQLVEQRQLARQRLACGVQDAAFERG